MFADHSQFSIRRRSGQKGDETAKPVEFARQLVESASSTESASSIKSARSIEFCEIDRVWIKLKIASYDVQQSNTAISIM